MADSTVARRFAVEGRVQGVGYRNFAQRAANKLGLTGWVRNRSDGSVEVFAQGTTERIATFESELRIGPVWAEVRQVEATAAGPEKLASFFIRP